MMKQCRIKALRAQKKWTQTQLADRLHVTLWAVQKYEAGSKMERPVARLFELLEIGMDI